MVVLECTDKVIKNELNLEIPYAHLYLSQQKVYVAKFICPYSSAQLYIQKRKYRYKSRFVRHNHPLSVISLNRANILLILIAIY